MSAPQTVADVLDAAADDLTPAGAWHQGSWQSHDGSACCVITAITQASTRLSVSSLPALRAFRETIGTVRAGGWNDAPGRTQSEVVAALRAAATSARQGETK